MWAGLMQGGAAVDWIPVNAVPHSNEVEAQNNGISLLSKKFYFRHSIITSSCRVFNVEVGCRHLDKIFPTPSYLLRRRLY